MVQAHAFDEDRLQRMKLVLMQLGIQSFGYLLPSLE